jgi:hypothetical protein
MSDFEKTETASVMGKVVTPRLSAMPPQFADLESWARKFAGTTEKERYETRANADMAELRSFYDAVLPRMADVFDHLSKYSTEEAVPSEARALANLACAFMEASLSVEVFGVPVSGEGLDWKRIGIIF